MTLCSRCHKRPATVFESMGKNGTSDWEGLCLACAVEENATPMAEYIKSRGMSEEEIDAMNNEMAQVIDTVQKNPDELHSFLEQILPKTENGEMPKINMQIVPGMNFSGEDFSEMMDSFAQMMGGDMMGEEFSEEYEEIEETPDNKTEEAPEEKPKKRRFETFFVGGPGGSGGKKKQKKSILDTYGDNLTALAREGKLDRVLGRDTEIQRVIQILNRREKNNPVILGEPGVGKTAIVEALAQLVAEGSVPLKLIGKEIYRLDISSLVAGTQFRGQFESRIQSLIKECKERGDIILFIDEVHTIVDAGSADGAMNAANLLKPALSRGDINAIGATTLDEYREYIETDAALERRFQPVIIDEPDMEETVEIIKGIKSYYEDYHKLVISDEVIVETCRMCDRYITDRFFPDKAIDVLDEAASRVNLANKALVEADGIKKELETVTTEADEAGEVQDYEKYATLRQKQAELSEALAEKNEEAKKSELTSEDVAAVIEMWTKIPVHTITESESEKLLQLEERIHARVIGQEEAVDAVSRAIRRGRANLTARKRPVSFIFAGPTGVGKTELVKTIAEVMFDSEDALIRLDMSEYMEKHSVSKIIGSPPGYVGYDEAGQLTEKIRRNPYSVILLDEIEKAHPDVFNLFLQVLDEGRVSDSHGRMINFENTIIVMTTNAGSEANVSTVGFNSDSDRSQKNKTEKSLREYFRPEFLNRVDEIITFTSLNTEELKAIIDLLLEDIKEGMAEKNSTLVVSEAAKDLILEKGYDKKYGARPLKRAIQRLLEDPLAEFALKNDITNREITADSDGDLIKIS
ncbi:MAG: ATP-dependent Clp protease ATP-binding subunit [Ruminococcaceae bacterium]|nr:ATP-dependent Clp protease ATP-binding subunit [Oscillospiraceae bacterium]